MKPFTIALALVVAVMLAGIEAALWVLSLFSIGG